MRPVLPSLACVLLCSLASSPARAWTDAQVHGAEADVVMDRDGRAEITLTLSLRVRGGWLEGLEVAGLEADATLLGAPTMVSIPPEGETPERFTPRAQVRSPRGAEPDARIQLSFRRRESPRRGRYRIVVRYTTDLGARLMPREEGGWKGDWMLPAWRSGLDGVRIALRLPPGARFDPDVAQRALVERRRYDDGGQTVLQWERAHLPRTTDWQLHFTLPEGAIAPELGERLRVGETAEAPASAEAAAPEHAAVVEASEPTPKRSLPAWLAVLVALAMGLTGELFVREAVRRRARPRPVVSSRALRIVLLASGVGLDAAFGSQHPWVRACLVVFIVAVAWQRSAEPAAPKPGGWRLDAGTTLPGPGPWTGLAAAAGWLTLVGGSLLLGDLGHPSWAVVALAAPLLHGGARRLPPALATQRDELRQLAGWMRAPEDAALAIVVHEDDEGPGDVRLRWTLARPRPGIHRLDVVLTDERGPGGLLRKARLLVVTDADSLAERHLTRLAPAPEAGPTRLPGGRAMRLYRVAAMPTLLELLQHEIPATTAPIRRAA